MSIFDVFRKKKDIPEPWAKYYNEADFKIELPDISMYEQVKSVSQKYPNNIAYKYFNVSVSYQNFMKQIDLVADSFNTLGINKGDVVTLCMPNIPEVVMCVYALNKIGAISNMLHPLSAPTEIKASLDSTNSKYLVMIDMFYEKIESIISFTNVEKVIFTSPSDSLKTMMKMGYKISNFNKYKKYPKKEMYLSFKKFLKLGKGKTYTYPKYGKNTPAVILHSGGTSGVPKNVVIQNRAFVLGAISEKISLPRLEIGDSCLAIMPNFHGFGLGVSIHTPLSLGLTTILIPQFNSRKFDTLFKKNKPNVVLGVPTLYEALINCNNEKDLDLSFLKYVICGGDILSKNLEDRVNDYLKGHNASTKIVQGYGLSEVLAAVCLAHDDIYKPGSIGIPLVGSHFKIIDSSSRKTLPYGETGEICIHTKAFMMGYLNNESETNEALQIHDDGHIWLHTGDLGYMDSDGFVFYKGRAKRMIVSSGYNIYPSHVEEVIESHPAVLQCTVVGVPHHYKQEVPKAFIVLKEGYHGILVKNEIKDYCKKNLAKYMVPHTFVYRKKLPTTKLGKVDFRKLQSDIGVDDDE